MMPAKSRTSSASHSGRVRDRADSAIPTEGVVGRALKRALDPALAAMIAIKIALLFVLCLNSVVVMDEFVQLGSAKYLSNGLFDTIWPVKAVGYVVFYKLAHIIGWDAVSTQLTGRLMTAMLGCGVVAMIFACARSLAASRTESMLVLVTLLSFSSFIERIFETRAEPLAVFFAVASLLVVLRGEPTARRIFLAGVMTGLAFITTQKSIYFNFALGAALVIEAALLREFRVAFGRGVWLLAGWLLPVIAYCLVFGGTAPLPVAHNLFFGPADLVSKVPKVYVGMERYLFATLQQNALLYAVCLAGMGLALTRIGRLPSGPRIALIFTILITALVYSHNQPWPYVFVMALPFLVLWVPILFEALSGKPSNVWLASLLVGLAVVISFVRNGVFLTQHGNASQFAVMRNAERLTAKSDRYFDGVGMLPNRSEPSTLWLDRPLIYRTLEQGQNSELFAIFTKSPPKTVIWSYRMDAVEPVIRRQLEASYVKVAPNIRVPGRNLERALPTVFDVPIAGRYTLYSDNGQALKGQIVIDGAAVELPVFLHKETVTIELAGGPNRALLVNQGFYLGIFNALAPDYELFDKVYD